MTREREETFNQYKENLENYMKILLSGQIKIVN